MASFPMRRSCSSSQTLRPRWESAGAEVRVRRGVEGAVESALLRGDRRLAMELRRGVGECLKAPEGLGVELETPAAPVDVDFSISACFSLSLSTGLG